MHQTGTSLAPGLSCTRPAGDARWEATCCSHRRCAQRFWCHGCCRARCPCPPPACAAPGLQRALLRACPPRAAPAAQHDLAACLLCAARLVSTCLRSAGLLQPRTAADPKPSTQGTGPPYSRCQRAQAASACNAQRHQSGTAHSDWQAARLAATCRPEPASPAAPGPAQIRSPGGPTDWYWRPGQYNGLIAWNSRQPCSNPAHLPGPPLRPALPRPPVSGPAPPSSSLLESSEMALPAPLDPWRTPPAAPG